MTTREFLTAVIASNISEEMNAKATALIDALDRKNSQRKAKPSKTAIANEPVKQAIYTHLSEVGRATASEVGEALTITTQKASALMRQMVEDGVLVASEVKVPKKGKVKSYTVVTLQ